jgi:hypothetical protein
MAVQWVGALAAARLPPLSAALAEAGCGDAGAGGGRDGLGLHRAPSSG